MKKIVCVLLMMVLLGSSAAADFHFVETKSIQALFTEDSRISTWVNYTDNNRLILVACVEADCVNAGMNYNPPDINSTNNYFYMYPVSKPNAVHIYILDNTLHYKHFMCSPEWNYIIYEDEGIHPITLEIELQNKKNGYYTLSSEKTLELSKNLETDITYDVPQTSMEKPKLTSKPTATPAPQTKSETNEPIVIKGPYKGNIVKVKAGNKTYKLHEEFKKVMDRYEAYYDSYISLIKSLDKSSSDYMARYADFMQKYTELVQMIESQEDMDLTTDETLYFVYVNNQITKKMLSAIQ